MVAPIQITAPAPIQITVLPSIETTVLAPIQITVVAPIQITALAPIQISLCWLPYRPRRRCWCRAEQWLAAGLRRALWEGRRSRDRGSREGVGKIAAGGRPEAWWFRGNTSANCQVSELFASPAA